MAALRDIPGSPAGIPRPHSSAGEPAGASGSGISGRVQVQAEAQEEQQQTAGDAAAASQAGSEAQVMHGSTSSWSPAQEAGSGGAVQTEAGSRGEARRSTASSWSPAKDGGSGSAAAAVLQGGSGAQARRSSTSSWSSAKEAGSGGARRGSVEGHKSSLRSEGSSRPLLAPAQVAFNPETRFEAHLASSWQAHVQDTPAGSSSPQKGRPRSISAQVGLAVQHAVSSCWSWLLQTAFAVVRGVCVQILLQYVSPPPPCCQAVTKKPKSQSCTAPVLLPQVELPAPASPAARRRSGRCVPPLLCPLKDTVCQLCSCSLMQLTPVNDTATYVSKTHTDAKCQKPLPLCKCTGDPGAGHPE